MKRFIYNSQAPVHWSKCLLKQKQLHCPIYEALQTLRLQQLIHSNSTVGMWKYKFYFDYFELKKVRLILLKTAQYPKSFLKSNSLVEHIQMLFLIKQ